MGGQLADQAIGQMIEKHGNTMAYQVAEVYAFRGDTDRALEWLELAHAQRDGGLAYMRGDPLFKNVERDPRFVAFVKKMGFPP